MSDHEMQQANILAAEIFELIKSKKLTYLVCKKAISAASEMCGEQILRWWDEIDNTVIK